MKNTKTAVITVTLFLFIYTALFSTGLSVTILSYMFLASPFLLIWMVYTVLKDDYKYPELAEGDEWGYRDKAKDTLGMF
ncbi:hypothetical protein KHS38_04030 [Mucilaginibacter sp. Bleaf8]|uniref:hypothetical protein n=1 Tax=Mucilaginibacter sp. Bleaf8 TaxID=2834430 RepID=UPI001BCE7311|nr:hypothetical protein [Mucilaginibacter sp. Bleaf8]MBS7563566.1 hypothetical protein [Mucilaginibacter sp. Bleaf8]